MQPKTILVVHALNPTRKFILQRIKKMGLRVVCLNKERVAWAEASVDNWILADLNNHKECIDAVKKYNADHPNARVQGVVTYWDEAVFLVAHIAESLGLTGIPYAVTKQVKNKYNFRDFCTANGIKAPCHRLISGKKDIPKLEKHLNYPLVVKPVYGVYSAYVVRVNNRAELEETYDYVKNNIKSFWRTAEWVSLDLLVEEYIDGEEVDIDLLVQNGKIKFHSISDNFSKNKGRFFVDSGQSVPSNLPVKEQHELIAMAEETLEKLGIENGCIHFEAKYAKDGPYPIEVNMRMGGDYVYSYIKGAWGVDLIECSVKIALGEYIKINKPAVPHKYIVGWDLQPEHSGIVAELEVSPELEKKKYFEEMLLFREIGDVNLRPPEGYESLGWLTVSGDNSIDAQDNLAEALQLINYKIIEFDQESSAGKTARQNRLSAAVVKKDVILQAAKIEKVRRISLSDQRKLHIGIAGNKMHFNKKDVDEREVATTKFLEQELTKRGYDVTVFDFNTLDKTLEELLWSDINLMFNVTEGLHNSDMFKPQAAGLLEALRIPFTGSNSFTMALCQDKIRAKKLFNFHKIPTVPWDYAYTIQDTIDEKLVYPLVVKPSNANNSFGITNSSVVTNKRQLDAQLKRIIVDMGRPAVVEEYIEGDEYEVSILGNRNADVRVLPLARSVFSKMPKGYWHIYTGESRRENKGVYKKIITERPAKKVNPKLEALITEIALDAYKVMQCQDYGRVGVRVDKEGNPYVLEVDANPPLHEKSELVQAAKLTGMRYGDVLEEIISLAVKRYQNKKSI